MSAIDRALRQAGWTDQMVRLQNDLMVAGVEAPDTISPGEMRWHVGDPEFVTGELKVTENVRRDHWIGFVIECEGTGFDTFHWETRGPLSAQIKRVRLLIVLTLAGIPV